MRHFKKERLNVMPTLHFEKFDVNAVELAGRNLVEASAGTGKTFSVAILVLRMILEKDIHIEKILLVTFTNNAVAELEERIRLFVREAHDYAVNDKDVKDHIKAVVNRAKELTGEKTVQLRLKDALLFLDQLSVMTIHGFCKQSLSNQAFETGQLFSPELLTGMDDIYGIYVNDFWRTHVNTLPVGIFKVLKEEFGLSIGKITGLIKNFYANKIFYLFDPDKEYQLDIDDDAAGQLEKLDKNRRSARKDFDDYLRYHKAELKDLMDGNRYAKKQVGKLDNADLLWKFIDSNVKKTDYIREVFADTLMPLYERYQEAVDGSRALTTDILDNVYCYALQEITVKINKHLAGAGVISYDGLISNLHAAITGVNRVRIVRELQLQYDAVFVDEFQDTDKLQYEIFKTAFHENKIIFYIGDPKQSIYAFRQADINTYFAAYHEVDRRYTMNTNFRSSDRLISAMNQFFLPEPDFDTFYFGGSENVIKYIPVESSHAKGDFYFGRGLHAPLSIEKHKKKDKIFESLVNKILLLLTDNRCRIGEKDETRNIRPSDIGILVRNNDYGKELKELLNKNNIPAVNFKEARIMQTDEARSLYYILRAMYDPAIESINTGLLNKLTGKKTSELFGLKKEKLVELFRKYKAKWESGGVNQALSSFISDFGIQEYLIRPDTENGLRMISNLQQLKELLVKAEYHKNMNPADLLDWLRRAREQELLEDDESVIRLESDADSVTISTIHKAKGLQYNIVFAPQLDFIANTGSSEKMIDLYDDSRYVYLPVAKLSEEQKKKYLVQQEQENRRLLYVALTRSVYGCFVYRNEYFRSSTIGFFVNELRPDELIDIKELDKDSEFDNSQIRFMGEAAASARPEKVKAPLELTEPDWQFMSYSGLAAGHSPVSISDIANDRNKSEYDDFVFEKLRKGAITGTMLHEVLEKIDFSSDDKYGYVIRDTVARYAYSQMENYEKYLPELIAHILYARIATGFQTFRLREISKDKRLHELEFDFPVGRFDPASLTSLCATFGLNISMTDASGLYGMMNGFVDMLFEYAGKYYILDWKSNYLGDQVSDYEGNTLETAMTTSNYHLQYLIYTVAVVKYLKQRMPAFDYEKHFGGVIYCFLRGMRRDEKSGVFFKRPEGELIMKIN